MSDHPTQEMIDRVKSLAGGGDLKLMIESARRMALADRIVPLSLTQPRTTPTKSAEFLVIVDNRRKAVDVRFERGDEGLRSLEAELRGATYTTVIPGGTAMRLVLGVRVGCDAQRNCVAAVEYPSNLKLNE